jgi:hypothetical protein
VDEWEYKLDDGTGKNVGVAGREDGVGMELVVAVVLTLVAESRDCGRRMPVVIVLLKREPLSFCTGCGTADVEAPRRNAVGAVGLEARLRSFSTSFTFTGDGESSIISTQPEVSAPGVFFGLVSMSALLLTRLDLIVRSSVLLPRSELERIAVAGVLVNGNEDVSEVEPRVDAASAFAFGRPDKLPIRNRGTRVWIFCSKILTRARISLTICTPLLFWAAPGMPLAELVVDIDGFRERAGRTTGVRGGMRDVVDNEGNVVERGIGDDLELDGIDDLLGWKPAR